MICVECGKKSTVTNTVRDKGKVYRRRRCKGCGKAWYTEEVENAEASYLLHKIKDCKYRKEFDHESN